jgi:hypothetical protein
LRRVLPRARALKKAFTATVAWAVTAVAVGKGSEEEGPDLGGGERKHWEGRAKGGERGVREEAKEGGNWWGGGKRGMGRCVASDCVKCIQVHLIKNAASVTNHLWLTQRNKKKEQWGGTKRTHPLSPSLLNFSR